MLDAPYNQYDEDDDNTFVHALYDQIPFVHSVVYCRLKDYKGRKQKYVMNVVPLDSRLEPMFWEYVYQDIPHHFFFILDMKRSRASTEILLALDETDHIEGMMMTYKDKIVQLRGTTEAAKALLTQLTIRKVEIEGLEEHRTLILEKFEKVEKILEITLMTLKRGEEIPQLRHEVERLSINDAEDVAALMREGDPSWWREITAEKIADEMDERLWLGIRVGGQLVSLGGATIDEWGSNISAVVTHENYRNRGYATSVVSALVGEIVQKSAVALIHVETANTPAVRAYTAVGFKPCKKYVVARAVL